MIGGCWSCRLAFILRERYFFKGQTITRIMWQGIKSNICFINLTDYRSRCEINKKTRKRRRDTNKFFSANKIEIEKIFFSSSFDHRRHRCENVIKCRKSKSKWFDEFCNLHTNIQIRYLLPMWRTLMLTSSYVCSILFIKTLHDLIFSSEAILIKILSYLYAVRLLLYLKSRHLCRNAIVKESRRTDDTINKKKHVFDDMDLNISVSGLKY